MDEVYATVLQNDFHLMETLGRGPSAPPETFIPFITLIERLLE